MNKKKSYKEQTQYGQGYDLEPISHHEIKNGRREAVNKEFDEERRLNGSNLDMYFKENKRLGSNSVYDDYGDEAWP